MTAPVAVGCAAAAVLLGVPVVAAAAQLEAHQRAAVTADAAALGAADALAGWVDGQPCALAAETAAAARGELLSCELDPGLGEARVRVAIGSGTLRSEARARAAPLASLDAPAQEGGAGWVWPAPTRGISQGFHDGLAIDLEAPLGSVLLAPHGGVVVFAGSDGAGPPEACRIHPDWWRGPNYTVIMRHDLADRVVYSSHNHVAPGSPERLGIRAGVPVIAGQPVAHAGMSGCTSGPHTHFTLSTTPGNAFPDVNPFDYLGPP